MKTKSIIFIGVLLLFTFSAFSSEEILEEGLPKFYKVDEGVYRSARPFGNGLEIAKTKYGITTIINLENDDKAVAAESRVAKALGLDFIWSEMAWYKTPKDNQVDQVLARVADKTLGAVLVHCHEGKDRTGLIMGLYRVFYQNWEPDAAYREMLDLGFEPLIFKFKNYFKKRTRGLRTKESASPVEVRELTNLLPGGFRKVKLPGDFEVE